MSTTDDIKELVEKLMRIEGEKQLLSEEQKPNLDLV